METPTLAAYIMPSIFSDEAIAAARAGAVAALSSDLCIIKFCLALTDGDLATAQACHGRLETQTLGGWPLYQVTTGAVFLAIMKGDEAAIIAAIDAWLKGLAAYPGNWQTGLLQAPEVVPWLSGFDPKRFQPPPVRKRRLTPRQRAFVRDSERAIGQAVIDNLDWFRACDFDQSADTIAKWYKLSEVSLRLRECTYDADNDAPSLIVILDALGNYTGSFMAH